MPKIDEARNSAVLDGEIELLTKWLALASVDQRLATAIEAVIRDRERLIRKLRGLSSPEPVAPILPPGFAACSDCPPLGYPTDKTRCVGCPRAAPSNPQVRPEQANAQQDGAADNKVGGVMSDTPAEIAARLGCMDCGLDYEKDFAMDCILTRDQWLMIHPAQGGVLCANCMVRRASRLPRVIGFAASITFIEDYESLPPLERIAHLEQANKELLDALDKCVYGLGCQPGYVNGLALSIARAALSKHGGTK